MNVMPMKSFQGSDLTTKLQELANKDYWSYYQLSEDENKRYILSISKQKKTQENKISEAFWHFVSIW